jgi:hypothetical protein
MKNIFKLVLALTLIVSTVSCRQNRQPYHEVVYNAQGEQMVKVQDYDQNGNLIEYYIAYAMFNQLYNNGGYRSVNHYYYDNRPAFDRSYVNYDRAYQYDSNPRQTYQDQNVVNTAPAQKPAYRQSSPKTSNITYTDTKPSTVTYRPSSPITTKQTTYRPSSPTTTSSYKPSSPSTSTSSYRTSSPSSSYKSTSSYRSSSPSSSSYRSSSPSSSSSYRSSSPSTSSYRSSSSYSSSSSSYRSSSPSSSSRR